MPTISPLGRNTFSWDESMALDLLNWIIAVLNHHAAFIWFLVSSFVVLDFAIGEQ